MVFMVFVQLEVFRSFVDLSDSYRHKSQLSNVWLYHIVSYECYKPVVQNVRPMGRYFCHYFCVYKFFIGHDLTYYSRAIGYTNN